MLHVIIIGYVSTGCNYLFILSIIYSGSVLAQKSTKQFYDWGDGMSEFRQGWGTIRFTLAEYMKAHGISKSQLAKRADLQYTQMLTYYNNTVQRPDVGVLCRICYVLNCGVSDILHYDPPED